MLVSVKKPKVIRIYLNEEDTDRLDKICIATELGQTELLSKAAIAALKAIESNNSRITLPLRLSVVDPPETSNGRKK